MIILFQNLVHHPVLERFFGIRPVVSVHIREHAGVFLLGMFGNERTELFPDFLNILGGNENVGGLSLHTAKQLMDQYPGMRQAEFLPSSAGTKQNSAHGSSHTRADGGDIRFDELHRA